MISDLNTFVQYFAALYFTICIDSVVTQRFWSPDYYKKVTQTIGLYNFQQSRTIKSKIDKNVKEKADELRDQATKRGVLMLLVCIAIMVFAAFENSLVGLVANAFYSYAICYYFLVFLFSRSLLKTWAGMFFFYLFPIALSILSTSIFGFSSIAMTSSEGEAPLWLMVGKYAKPLTCILIIVPVLHQLFVNWLYSKAYLRNIHCNLKNEFEKYERTNLAIEKKDKTLADPVYNEVFAEFFFSDDGKDVVITRFNDLVASRIIYACKAPKVFGLLVSYWNNRKVELPAIPSPNDLDLDDEEYEIPKERNISNEELQKAYEEYESMTGKKLADFCKERNIPLKLFKRYRDSMNYRKSKKGKQ